MRSFKHVCVYSVNTLVFPRPSLITIVKTLADVIKGRREALGWSQYKLAKEAGVSQSTVGNIEAGTRGHLGRTPPSLPQIARALGATTDELLREAGQPSGASAAASPAAPSPASADPTGFEVPAPAPPSGGVSIPQLDVRASMGPGAIVPSHEDVVTVLQVDEQALRSQLGNTPVSSLRNLRLISACGDSMAPTFAGGDFMLVDTGVGDVRLDAVYVLSYRHELFIKRLQRLPGGVLRMLSDNKLYDPIDIDTSGREELRVLGRVLMAWNSRKL